MTAAARNTRKNIEIARNAARQSIPRNTSLINPSITRSTSPSLTALDATALNRAKHDSAIRSARAKAGHATRRARELSSFGRPLTTQERRFQRFMQTYLNEVLLPQCVAEDIDPVLVVNYALEQACATVKARTLH